MSERKCIDCKSDISHRNVLAKLCIDCNNARQKVRKDRHNKERLDGREPRQYVKRVTQGRVINPEREKQDTCMTCFGMPWARMLSRTNETHEGRHGKPVAYLDGDNTYCCECKLPYAPEPEPERNYSLPSNAGIAVRSAPLYAMSSVTRGVKKS